MRFNYDHSRHLAGQKLDDISYLAENFCPDEILLPVARNYRSLKKHFNKAARDLRALRIASRNDHNENFRRSYSHQQAVALKDKTLIAIDPDNRFDFHNMDHGYFVARRHDFSSGHVHEQYGQWEIELFQSGAIKDLFILVHEYGHYAANRKFENFKFPTAKPAYLRETQAFFLEAAAYDYASKTRNKMETLSARTQRILEQLDDLDQCIFSDSLVQEEGFDTLEFILQNRHTNAAWGLHKHPTGMIVGFGLYGIFRNADADTRHNILSALYERGDDANMEDILRAAGIDTPEAIAGFVKDSFYSLLNHCNTFLKASAKIQSLKQPPNPVLA